jgi:hypothetical protein
MSHTRRGIPLWSYYQQLVPISDLSDIQEGNLYFMSEIGAASEVVTIINKNLAENTITLQTLERKEMKTKNLHYFKNGSIKFYENEIDP